MTRPRTPGVGADAVSIGVGLQSSAQSSNGLNNGLAVKKLSTTKNQTIKTTTMSKRVSEVMELSYVTERIIALWYREDAQGILEQATSLLRGKHADNYVVSPIN